MYDDRKIIEKSQNDREHDGNDKSTKRTDNIGPINEFHNILGNKGMLNLLDSQEDNEVNDEFYKDIDAKEKITIDGEEHTLAVEWQGDKFVVMRHSVPVDFLKELESLIGVIDSGQVPATVNIRGDLYACIENLYASNAALLWLNSIFVVDETFMTTYKNNYSADINKSLEDLCLLRSQRRYSRKDAATLKDKLFDQLNLYEAQQLKNINALYANHGNYIDELYKLIPGRFRNEEEVVIQANHKKEIATGDAGDPIPIKWYKNPIDYKNIDLQGHSFGYNQTFSLMDQGIAYKFGVSNNNMIKPGDKIRKVNSSQNRVNQQYLNYVLKVNGYDLSAKGKDGDHVKDLGFDGQDVNDNYWPLDSDKNRYAFFYYNPHYEVLYKVGDKIMKAPIGRLIGKWFVVSEYLVQGEKLGAEVYYDWLKKIKNLQ